MEPVKWALTAMIILQGPVGIERPVPHFTMHHSKDECEFQRAILRVVAGPALIRSACTDLSAKSPPALRPSVRFLPIAGLR